MNAMDGFSEGQTHNSPDVKRAEARRKLDEQGSATLAEFTEKLSKFEVWVGEMYIQAHAAERWVQENAVRIEQRLEGASGAARVGLLKELAVMHEDVDRMWKTVETGMQKMLQMEKALQRLSDSLSSIRRKYMN